MKEKPTPGIFLLVCTGILFIAGIFFIEFRTARQISDYETQLNSYIKQVDAQKEKLNKASESFASAIQSQKDLLNWKKQQNSGSHKAVDERLSEAKNSESQTSIFSQNTSPEYNSFTSDGYQDSDEISSSNDTSQISQQNSEDFSSGEPAA